MAQLISNLPVGALIKDSSSVFLGEPITWKIADKNHTGYPSNSVTLITENIIALRTFDAAESQDIYGINSSYYRGYNRYLSSNIRQWLNSDASSGNWFTAQSAADLPPSEENLSSKNNPYESKAGFLNCFSTKFKNSLLNTTLTTALYPTIDGVTAETMTDKIFLPSTAEVGLSNTNSIAEGSILALFNEDTSNLIAYSTTAAELEDNYFDYTASHKQMWMLRTPYANAYNYRVINASGTLTYYYAYSDYIGVRPLCNISSSVYVSDEVDADGYYTLFADTTFYKTEWINPDGTVIATNYTEKNQIPVYPENTPTQEEDQEYWYTFNTWTPAIAAATSDIVYTATYTTETSYTYTFYAKDGKTILQTDILHYNDTIPTAPTAPVVAGYNFTQYSGYTEGMTITQDIDFIAQYEIIPGRLDAEGTAHLLRSIKFQYQNIPQPSAAFENKIVQPVINSVTTSMQFNRGYSYICLKNSSNNNYYWKRIDTQPESELEENLMVGTYGAIESINAASSSGEDSIAIGDNVEADGDYSAAFGYNSRSDGSYCIVAGSNCKTNENYSVALGRNCRVEGLYSMAVGRNCYTDMEIYGAIATGYYANVYGDYGAHAAGRNISTYVDSSFICGQYGSLTTPAYTNTLFAVASGESGSNHIGMHFAGLNGNGVLYIENKPAVTSVQGLTSIWAGTQSQYNAISTKNATTLYIITQ